MELGIYTFGDIVADPHTGQSVSPQQRMDQILECAKLADDAGLDLFGVGEHHALRYVNSATATMLAAIAAATKRIRLTSASTSISTADPVRTFQEFATADLVSHGRVEIIFGRGAFTDNFPLFGYDLNDYDELFVEKLGLFAELNEHERVSWSGRFRPALNHAEIAPRPAQSKIPVWIGAVSPNSVARAAAWGFPLAVPMVGGTLRGYAQSIELYRQIWQQSGRAPGAARVATFEHLHVADAPQHVRGQFYPYYSAYLSPLFKGPMPAAAFEQMLAPQGTLVAGSAQQVIDKLLTQHEVFGTARFFGQIDIGGQPHADVMRGIERFATLVAPVVRRETAGRSLTNT
jgi:alkanesulfonate monooxygenase SsuD/methylene tetrahydromethanopterin reductase-like flavin-dependent oxidoreductase (luciferase family)